MANTLLDIENAVKLYRGHRGVKTATLSVCTGEIVGLLGPNGSGKTTLMKLITGLCRPDSGRVTVDGVNVADDPARALKHVGALIETPALYEYMSARANLRVKQMALGVRSHAQADMLLSRVGLLSSASMRAGKLSLGMKQRLGLALAFLGDPKLLVLDEPTNGLDIDASLSVREQITGVCRETGAAALISSHHALELEKICDRVIVLSEGAIIAQTDMRAALDMHGTLEDYYLSVIHEKGVNLA